MSKQNEPWQRRGNESARAFAAFIIYRDLGPERSLDGAYRTQRCCKSGAVRADSRWCKWSARHSWPARAEAWDAHLQGIADRARENALKALAKERAEFEIAEFERLVARVRRAEQLLDKADNRPLSDVDVEEHGADSEGRLTHKRQRVKGLNFAGYAALMREARESALLAVLGPRAGDSSGKPPVPAFTVLTWREGDEAEKERTAG